MGFLFKAFDAIQFLVIIYIIVYRILLPIEQDLDFVGKQQREIKQIGPLLDKNGQLVESGWSRHPLKQFNPEQTSFFNRFLRLKQWEYFHISRGDIYFGISFADVSYAQNIQFVYFDQVRELLIKKELAPVKFVHQAIVMKNTPFVQDQYQYEFKDSHNQVKFLEYQDQDYEYREIFVNTHTFIADIQIKNSKKHDSMVIVVPINEDGSKFYYNVKSYGWDVTGYISINSVRQELYNTTAGYDWGRGVFDYNTFWLWMSGHGVQDDHKIAINLGGGFAHKSSPATEEAFFYDEKLFKLKNLDYIYDDASSDKPILVISHNRKKDHFNDKSNLKQGDFYCEFVPTIQSVHQKDFIFIALNMKQQLGYFSGVYFDGSSIIKYTNILGMIEFNKSKW
ncbi:hypothetical protein pb186bvf_009532 [Paramecium bursaria]